MIMVVSRIGSRRGTEAIESTSSVMTETELLERRLEEGERHIALAEARGEDTTRLVDFWIELLHRYERSVDSMAHAA
jgi:hypothetical protein